MVVSLTCSVDFDTRMNTMKYTYDYPRPSVTVDSVIFGVNNRYLKVLLIKRKDAPFANHWALPGGFVQMGEDLNTAAERELLEETGYIPSYMEQLKTYGSVKRDPRGRVITVAYMALVPLQSDMVKAGSDAAEADWWETSNLPDLAFDHAEIIRDAKQRLRAKITYSPIGFDLLSKEFSLGDLQALYETVLGHGLDKRNFRNKILSTGLLKDTGKKNDNARPSKLYKFDREEYNRLSVRGFEFQI